MGSFLYRLWLAYGPRPPQIRRSRLLEVLRPGSDERILEVGPGAGYYAIPVAQRLGPTGTLAVVDVDEDMLNTTVRRLEKRRLGERVQARRADAASLPFHDDSFDAAFLVAVLGEVRERRSALRELHRVLHPGARLVIGEVRLDPHAIRPDQLREETESEGFSFDIQVGGRSGYIARFVCVSAQSASHAAGGRPETR